MEEPGKRHFNILPKIILGIFLFFLLVFLGITILIKKGETGIKSQEGRVNLLILGKSGAGYSAPDLTDTMVLLSVSLEKEKTVLISIPRDLWVAEIRAKINSAYYWGKEKPELGGGLKFAKENVERVVGVSVNYALVLDFSSFKQIIDVLGGIDVTVEKAFTDTKFPVVGKEEDLCDGDKELKCRYEALHFESGEQIMNGETALKFVRSRNGDNEENTDLAREARQQKVIGAIKNKVLQPTTFLNPLKMVKLFKVIKASIETDLGFWDEVVLAKKLLVGSQGIETFVFPDDFLVVSQKDKKYDYQYVFLSKSGSWQEIQNWIKGLLFKN